MTDETRHSPAATVSHAKRRRAVDPYPRWSCDQHDRNRCRNPFGCHCREITALIRARDELVADRARIANNRDMWKGQSERQAKQLTAYQRPEGT